MSFLFKNYLLVKVIYLLVRCYKTTTTDKIFEKNSTCEIAHYGESSISIFKESFASIDKFSFWEEDRALGYNYMKF